MDQDRENFKEYKKMYSAAKGRCVRFVNVIPHRSLCL
jgi:hypothetical protein